MFSVTASNGENMDNYPNYTPLVPAQVKPGLITQSAYREIRYR